MAKMLTGPPPMDGQQIEPPVEFLIGRVDDQAAVFADPIGLNVTSAGSSAFSLTMVPPPVVLQQLDPVRDVLNGTVHDACPGGTDLEKS